MIHNAYHSAFGTYDCENDERQAKLTLLLSAIMSVVVVALIIAGCLSTRACAV
jgi:hypothetical protein